MADPVSSRLDSWKEIAAYLHRDLRTARRWEIERGLPVHRVPGAGRGSVYAFSREIDTWLLENDPRNISVKEAGYTVASPFPTGWNSSDDRPSASILSLHGHPEDKSGHGRLEPSSQSIFRRKANRIIPLIVGVASCAILALLFARPRASKVMEAGEEIQIESVSKILSRKDQTLYIRGTGFGLHTHYSNDDSPFIAIRDKTAGWAAGRLIPQNWDQVTLDVQSWEDTQIVVSGFAGAYGQNGWELRPDDKIEIAVWNPQTGRGPALYDLTIAREP